MIVFKEAEISGATETASVEKTVRDILDAVRSGGDEAVRNYTEKFDGFRPASLRVEEKTVREAYGKVAPETVGPCSLRP